MVHTSHSQRKGNLEVYPRDYLKSNFIHYWCKLLVTQTHNCRTLGCLLSNCPQLKTKDQIC